MSSGSQLAVVVSNWLAGHPQPMSGDAFVCFMPDAGAPVGVTTRAFASSPVPHSLDVVLYDPAEREPTFLMVVSLAGDYIGPGEYRGGVRDVLVGLGVANADGTGSTWTAAESTMSDLVAYSGGTAATLTSAGLVSGPILGPASADQPACSILFAWFELGGS